MSVHSAPTARRHRRRRHIGHCGAQYQRAHVYFYITRPRIEQKSLLLPTIHTSKPLLLNRVRPFAWY